MTDLNENRKLEFEKTREIEKENKTLKDKLRNLTQIIIRLLVSIKYLFRLGAIAGTYFWLGKYPAAALCGFICLVATMQLAIDKVQRVLHPGWEVSEWDLE
jgi:hypothetical protein